MAIFREETGKKYPAEISICSYNIHPPALRPFSLCPRRRDRRPGIVGPVMAWITAHELPFYVGIGPLPEPVQAPCNLNRPSGRAQEVERHGFAAYLRRPAAAEELLETGGNDRDLADSVVEALHRSRRKVPGLGCEFVEGAPIFPSQDTKIK